MSRTAYIYDDLKVTNDHWSREARRTFRTLTPTPEQRRIAKVLGFGEMYGGHIGHMYSEQRLSLIHI